MIRLKIVIAWALLLSSLTSGVWAGGGYLSKLGPSPLRFQQLPPRADIATALPPLQMSDKPTTPEASGTTPAPVEDYGPELPPITIEPQPEPEVNATAVPEPQPVEEEPISPQMLLRYFNNGGNKEAIIQAPMEFTPPAPTRGSSATYSSQ